MELYNIQNQLNSIFPELPIINNKFSIEDQFSLLVEQNIFYGKKLLTIIQKIQSSHKFESQLCTQALKKLKKIFKLILPNKQETNFQQVIIALKKTLKSQKENRYKVFTLNKEVIFLKKMVQLKRDNKIKTVPSQQGDYLQMLNQILQSIDQLSIQIKKILCLIKKGDQGLIIKILNKMHVSLLKMAELASQKTTNDSESKILKEISEEYYGNTSRQSQQQFLKNQIKILKERLSKAEIQLQKGMNNEYVNILEQQQKQKLLKVEQDLKNMLGQYQIIQKKNLMLEQQIQKLNHGLNYQLNEKQQLKRQIQDLLIELGQNQKKILNFQKQKDKQKLVKSQVVSISQKEKKWIEQKHDFEELIRLIQEKGRNECEQLVRRLQLFDSELLKKQQQIKDLHQLVQLLEEQNQDLKNKKF